MSNPFNIQALVQSVMSKYNETVENTVFELMHYVDCSTLAELKMKGYKLNNEFIDGSSITVLSLTYESESISKHIMTYRIYFDFEENKIKRKRLINNLEEEDDEI